MRFEKGIKLILLSFVIILILLAPVYSALASDFSTLMQEFFSTDKPPQPSVSLAISNPPSGQLDPETYYKLAVYNFISTSSPVVIQEMKFAITGASEMDYFFIAGKSVYPVYDKKEGWTVDFTDLNIPIETKRSGTDITILGFTNRFTLKADTNNKPISLILKSYKYSYGPNNLRTNMSKANATSSTFYLSGSKISIFLTPRSDELLRNKEMNLLNIRIQSGTRGPVRIKSLPLSIISVGNAILSAANSLTIKIDGKNLENVRVSTSSFPVAGKTGSTTINFIDGYVLPAGKEVIFSIYGTPENVYYHPAGNSISISLGDKKYFLWDDINSENFNLNGNFAANYASNASILVNEKAQEQELFVKVINPMAGEIWRINEKKEIKWEATGGKGFSVYLINKNNADECLVGVYPYSARSASFNVNNTSCKSNISIGDYKATVSNNPYNITSKMSTTTSVSQDFQIINSSAVRIVYPVGGEVIKGGEKINLRWIDSNTDSKPKINLSLLKISDATSTITAKTVIPNIYSASSITPVTINNIGAYDWDIKPESGQYLLRLSCGEAKVCGITDSKPFTFIK